MKIERIDDNTIKCFISCEEMAEHNVEYTDFLSRTEKAQEFMHEIIRRAHEEVGYKPPKFAFEMQIMLVPEQGMVLTFSEKEPFDIHDKGKVDAFLEHLKDFVGKLSEHKENLESGGALDELFKAASLAKGNEQPTKDEIPVAVDKKTKIDKADEINEAIFAFASLAQVMDFADSLPANIRITSELYKMNGDYFMHITKGGASYDRYSKVCVVALEFAELYRAGNGCDEVLKEYGELLINEKAIKKLRSK